MTQFIIRRFSPSDVRAELLAGREILLLDLREEHDFAGGHPLWAANFPLGKLELEVLSRIPRLDTLIVVYGVQDGEDLAPAGANRLTALGYINVFVLGGGLDAWIASGGEIFIDVNVPSKAFGELVEHHRKTPLLEPEKVKALLDEGADAIVVDARRFDEYQTMNIPGSLSVPGAELVLRVREIAPRPETLVIVNCAGRTRSIIGTQSLINAGIPNRVVGLRNGTIGWTLAGQTLEHGADRKFPAVSDARRQEAQAAARAVAEKSGVKRIGIDEISGLKRPDRTLYRFDVRTAEEFAAGHLPGFAHVAGGQLVQETDHYAPVRGALLILADDDGVRADMSASWLAQMGWNVLVVDPVAAELRSELGGGRPRLPPLPQGQTITPQQLADWLPDARTHVLNVTTSANHVRGHIPGAWFVLRSQLPKVIEKLGPAERIVVTCKSSTLAHFAADDLRELTSLPVYVVEGGNDAWVAAGLPVETGETRLLSPRIDRYKRPYEGTDAPVSAMQAYLDWEYGLVEQLRRDGTHGFAVL